MISIVIVTHGKFGTELLNSAELIVGKQENVSTLNLNHGDNISELQENVSREIVELNKEYEVLVFTDLFGGSPTNSAAINMGTLKFKCITGINLPMLLEALVSRLDENLDINEIVKKCLKAGVDGIKNLEEMFLKGGEI